MMDIYSILKNISGSYQPVFSLLMDFCMIVGFFMVFWGLDAMRPDGAFQRQSSSGVRPALWSIGIGASLIFLPSAIDAWSQTLFASSSDPYAFAYEADTSVDDNPFAPIKAFVQLFGAFAFVNGLLTLRSYGVNGSRGNATVKKAVVLLVSGILLINIDKFSSAIAVSLGVSSSGVSI